MKIPIQTRTAVIVPMASSGTHAAPALAALFAACRKQYGSAVYVADARDLCMMTREQLVRVRDAASLLSARRIEPVDLSLQEIRDRSDALVDGLAALSADVFVVGDATAMRLAARLALWCRERQVSCRWVGVPACACNSVPFTVHNIGFGSALRWCASLGCAMLDARRLDARYHPVGILEIEDDSTGWLAAGTAALVGGEDGQALCLVPGMSVNADRLAAAVQRGVAQHGAVLLVVSADAAVPETLPSVVLRVCPREVMDPTYVSVQDAKDSVKVARAAVRLARTARADILVVGRYDDTGKLVVYGVPLQESVHTPRCLPADYVRTQNYQPSTKLAERVARFRK